LGKKVINTLGRQRPGIIGGCMKTYSIDIVKLPADLKPKRLAEAIIDDETGEAAFIVGENDRDFALRLVEFANRMERLKNK
jgi:hypothetical protein